MNSVANRLNLEPALARSLGGAATLIVLIQTSLHPRALPTLSRHQIRHARIEQAAWLWAWALALQIAAPAVRIHGMHAHTFKADI